MAMIVGTANSATVCSARRRACLFHPKHRQHVERRIGTQQIVERVPQVLWIQRLIPSGQFVDDRLTRQACRLTKTAIDIALPGALFEKRDARADERDDEPDKERQRDAERPQLVPR